LTRDRLQAALSLLQGGQPLHHVTPNRFEPQDGRRDVASHAEEDAIRAYHTAFISAPSWRMAAMVFFEAERCVEG
jgi:hypothetical protein